jgi:hypothetical protein
MTMDFTRSRAGLVIALLAVTCIAGCTAPREPARQQPDRDSSGRAIEDASSAPTDPNAVRDSVRGATAEPQRPRVESIGDCAPRYSTGQLGACINNQPCRGFGVLGENGQPVCTCYGQTGGCAATERCDDRKLACVPETEPPRDRAPAK